MTTILIISALAGGLGGLTRLLVSGKGILPLPRIEQVSGGSPHLNLGFLAPIIIGAIAGALTNQALHVDGIVAFISGWAGADGVENAIERLLKK